MKYSTLSLFLFIAFHSALAQNSWQQVANFGGAGRDLAVGFSIGSKGYIGTGNDGVRRKDFWQYDPVADAWTQMADFGGTARDGAAGFSIGAKGYIGTGYDAANKKDFWEYDPAGNAWTQKADFGGTARQLTVGFSVGNKGYIGTGFNGNYLRDFWEYDPGTDTWTQKADLGGTYGRDYAVGFGLVDKGYIGTGRQTGVIQYSTDFWEYDPSNNTWTQKADFAGPARAYATGFGIGNYGYIGTGSSGATQYKDFWQYDPVANAWTQKADFGGVERIYAVGFSIGSKGFIGTGNGVGKRTDVWKFADVDSVCASPCSSWVSKSCTGCAAGCYIDAGTISPSPSLQTSNVVTNASSYGYIFWTFNAAADSTYYFDLCSSTGTSGSSWLRLHNARHTSPGNNYCMDTTNTPTLVLQNMQNGCAGTGAGLSKLIWTCQSSGTYYLESTIGPDSSFWGALGNQTAVLSYKSIPSFTNTCLDVFYDKGIDGTNGSSSKYNNNEDWIYTYYPSDTTTEAISVQFVSFSTSPGDVLCVYDGSSMHAPLIGCYSGPSITGAFTSTSTDGSLTFHFTSDDSLISDGWQANVSCMSNVGFGKYASARKIGIYPNPVRSQFEISGLGYGVNAHVELFNVLGEKVYSGNFKLQHSDIKPSIDISQLPAGVYIMKAEAGTEKYIQKIVISH